MWAAGACSVLLVLTISTAALGAASVTYVDANGNHVEDSCETGVVPNAVAAAASFAAADLDHDGKISESEALQAGWIGSENCVGGTTDPGLPPAPTPAPTDPPAAPGSGSGHHGHHHHHHHGHHHHGHH